MKTQLHSQSRNVGLPRGFALVVTLSLMILLTVIAVGLLTLSSISLRSSAQGSAMAAAKANARLALMLAIGDLQKYAGPDQRITATGSILDNPSAPKTIEMPNIAGVWESWKITPSSLPSSADYEKSGGKQGKFLSWLVSAPSPSTLGNQDFPTTSLASDKKVQLMPAITTAPFTSPSLYGGLVPVNNKGSGYSPGSFAYAVMDEGTKARIDTGYRKPTGTKVGDQTLALGSGVRADASKIQNLDALVWEKADLSLADNQLSKIISLESAELYQKQLGSTTSASLDDLANDITVSSAGVFSDVVNGGLKQDLNSILNASTAPSDLSGKGIYETQLGYNIPYLPISSSPGSAEPQWGPLYDFSSAYQSKVKDNSGIPSIDMVGPTGSNAASSWTVSTATSAPRESTQTTFLPSISKVQVFYSIVACPLLKTGGTDHILGNGNKASKEAYANGARYMLYLIYTPVITLHNPYNIALNIPKLSLEFKNVPLSIQISRNGGPYLPASPGAVQSLYQGNSNMGFSKPFKFTLRNTPEDSNSESFTMQPGELVVFSPDIPADANFEDDRAPGAAAYTNRTFVDTMDSGATSGGSVGDGLNTANQFASRGFRSVTSGYALDYINFGTSGNALDNPYTKIQGSGYLFSGPADNFRVKFRPTPDARVKDTPARKADKGTFSVIMSDGNTKAYTSLNFDFPTSTDGSLITGLEDALDIPADELIFPSTGPISINQLAIANAKVPIIDFPANCFAMITATAKTTLANQDDSNYDGRYATKPWSFTAPVGSFIKQRIEENKADQSVFPYELDLVSLDPTAGYGSEKYLTNDALGRGVGFTGHTKDKGIQFATLFDVPIAPLQSMPQLNAANLTNLNNVSRFLYPIGNSWAHPMLPTSAITGSALNSSMTALYDHSYLLNLSLYDSFYFSGIAPRTSSGPGLLTSASSSEIATDFVNGSGEMMTDARLIPWTPAGKTSSDVITTLADNKTARNQAASSQMMAGAFNVNSTSKSAWKAMLASVYSGDSMINAVDPTNTSGASKLETMEAAPTGNTRFSRFRLPNSESTASTSSDPSQNFFQGPRDITEDQLDTLAEEIVEQVKTRGPFLSMAEFVNRQIGSPSELTLKGALQAAIDKSDINTDAGTLSALNDTGYEIPETKVTSSVVTLGAATGRSDQGAPGNLSQADLLTVLGNAATVRSDTFRIRAYGDARDATNNITAKAWCEAVVQRTPDFVDSTNEAQTAMDDASLTTANKTFGRTFTIISFRWLDTSEI